MPKSAKKRRDKAADFSKAKLKLGKGKQLPTNAIDTSFKARSIALPSQSISLVRDDNEPTTKRQLTFDDLISHAKHYNVGVRKDAILGMRELLTEHWHIIDGSLTTLVNAIARLIADEDTGVRKVTLSFLSWLLDRLPEEDLLPHSPLLLLFTTSAQTHIFPEIRVDAIRFLDVLLERIPDAVTSGWDGSENTHGSRVLSGYMGLLSAGTSYGDSEGPAKATSTASVVLTSTSKLVVFRSLANFLRYTHSPDAQNKGKGKAASRDGLGSSTWYMADALRDSDIQQVFDSLLVPTSDAPVGHGWTAEAELDFDMAEEDFVQGFPLSNSSGSELWDLRYIQDGVNISSAPLEGTSLSVNSVTSKLQRTLQPTLTSTFLDYAPVVFSPGGSPPETERNLVLAVAEIAHYLYGALLRNSRSTSSHIEHTRSDLQTFLNYLSPYFPFIPRGKYDTQVEQAFQSLSLIYCELASLLTLATSIPSTANKTRKAKRLVEPMQASNVHSYVLGLLESNSPNELSRPLTSAAYASLLPTLWALISDPLLGKEVFDATIQHSIRSSAKSAVKKPSIEFIGRIILLSKDLQSVLDLRLVARDETNNWILHLPQVLWELGGGNIVVTEIILRFLLRYLQRALPDLSMLDSLCTRLSPYFTMEHPTKGQRQGPYSKLSSSAVRRRALDVVVTVIHLCGNTEAAGKLSDSVSVAVAETAEHEYWSGIVNL